MGQTWTNVSLPRVMFGQPGFQILCHADIEPIPIQSAAQDINIVEHPEAARLRTPCFDAAAFSCCA